MHTFRCEIGSSNQVMLPHCGLSEHTFWCWRHWALEGNQSLPPSLPHRHQLNSHQVAGNANQAQSELLKEVAGHIAARSAAASSLVGAEQVEHEDAKTAKKEEAEASRQAAAESRL